MHKGSYLILVALLLAACTCAVGQQAAPAPTPIEAASDDILILVNLTAKDLRFDAVPNPTVEFPGKPARVTAWVTDRQNLPDKVEPGVTYRNIGIQLRIASRFSDIERIVREALGEVPISDPGRATAASAPEAVRPTTGRPPAATPSPRP